MNSDIHAERKSFEMSKVEFTIKIKNVNQTDKKNEKFV